MATFVVEVLPLTAVEPHPNADRLELAVVGNYRVIVRKGEYRAGDLVAYIPEASALPDELVERLDIRAYLAGPRHDRVHATRLRGVLSQGLVYPAHADWVAGQDVAAELGVTKWEPEIPLHMRGTAGAAPSLVERLRCRAVQPLSAPADRWRAGLRDREDSWHLRRLRARRR